MKKCSNRTCEQQNPQPFENFNVDNSRKDGRGKWCKSCKRRSLVAKKKKNKKINENRELGTGTKTCCSAKCMQVNPQDVCRFNKNRATKDGYESWCRDCASDNARKFRDEHIELFILKSAKARAVKNKITFDITIEDITIPEICPVFGTKLSLTGKHNDRPSLDRVDNSKGYVKGNVAVISTKANSLKKDGDIERFEKIIKYMKDFFRQQKGP